MRKVLFLSFAAIVLLAAGCSVQPKNEAQDLSLGNTGTASLTVSLQGAKSSITVSSNTVTGAEFVLVNGSSVYSTNWFQGGPSIITFQGLSAGQCTFTVHDWDASGITNTSSVVFTLDAGHNYTINVMLGGSVSVSIGSNGGGSTVPSIPMPAYRVVNYYNADGSLAFYNVWTNFTGVAGAFGHFRYDTNGQITGYWADGNPAGGGHWAYDPGPDGIWVTPDDLSSTYQKYGTNTIDYYYDNTVASYCRCTYDANGNEVKRVSYVSPGFDGAWFTGDDQIPEPFVTNMFMGIYNDTPQPNAGSYFIETYSADKVIPLFWDWTSLKIYDGAGDNHVWFDTDDHVLVYAKHEFNDPVSPYWFTKEYVYTNAGPDGLWDTADDVLYMTLNAVNHY